jgi:hypothetical protein
LWRQVRWALATLLLTLLASFAISHFARQLTGGDERLSREPHPRGDRPMTKPSR